MFRSSAVRAIQKMAATSSRQSASSWKAGALPSRLTRVNHGAAVSVAATTATSSFSTRTTPAPPAPEMFCRQCEQTSQNYACTSVGVCGKTAETSSVQDSLNFVVQSVSQWAVAAQQSSDASAGVTEFLEEVNVWTLQSLFSTMTNVNFSSDRIVEYIEEGIRHQRKLEDLVVNKLGGTPPAPLIPAVDSSDASLSLLDQFLASGSNDWDKFGHLVSVPMRQERMNHPDCFALAELATYGIKGACAYAAHCHAMIEAMVDPNVRAEHEPAFHQITKDIQEAVAQIGVFDGSAAASSPGGDPQLDAALALVLSIGEINGRVLALLDQAHATQFGVPVPAQVQMTAVKGKAILMSGHDMQDLHALLEQTKGTGINVYTHGEMLPAHGYPTLKAYPHLVGNFGTAWQNQKFEFASFPGPVIVTTNCIVEPRRNYSNRLYTMNEVGYDGVTHIGKDRNFAPVIEQASALEGFPRTIEPASFHTVGFNHRVVLPLAGQVLEAAKTGDLSRIVLIGGCDGSQWERSYFTDLAESLPDDTLILTLGCAKNRLIQSEKLAGATLANGLPRVLDMGQCNDSYSAVVVATELAKALDCGVNDLPLSICLSHLEQKAAAVLLTLLHLGVKNIRLGPSLPAYITPNVLNMLVENYNIMPTGEVEADIKAMMAGK